MLEFFLIIARSDDWQKERRENVLTSCLDGRNHSFRPPLNGPSAQEKGNEENDQENEEQNLRYPSGCSGYAPKTEDRRDDRDDQKSNCP